MHSQTFIVLLVLERWINCSAFQIPNLARHQANDNAIISSIRMVKEGSSIDSLFGPRTDDNNVDVVLYSDETPTKKKRSAMSRWDSLNPKIKARIVQEAQERAMKNKKRREPAADKKRRLYTQYKEMQIQSKRAMYVQRTEPVKSESRTKLPDISPGDTLTGKVISLTRFGAYVDVGTEVDGLLHVSQITREEFVDHPRKYLTPGDDVEVRVVRLDPQLKKLQLTMLPDDVLEEENVMNKYEESVDGDEDDRIQLDEIEVDDELWGEIRRVTDYGAYVELGAVVRGFLHFMDHPMFGEVRGSHPKEFMRVGDRVRVWVSDVDGTQRRIKLTANRPAGLPGPRREIQWI
jgi:ribosomal protein S1